MIYMFVYLFQWHQHPRLFPQLTSFQTLFPHHPEGRTAPGAQTEGGVG